MKAAGMVMVTVAVKVKSFAKEGMNVNMIKRFLAIFASAVFAVASVFAETHYVSMTGSNVSPYTDWGNACTNIYPAYAVSSDGDTILVADGIYTQSVALLLGYGTAQSFTIQSVNGPSNTIIHSVIVGGDNWFRITGVTKCLFTGFTLTNGVTTGDAPVAIAANVTMSNCVVTGNKSSSWVGGLRMYKNSTLLNSIVRGNSGTNVSGGMSTEGTNWVIRDCAIDGNYSTGSGGGMYLSGAGIVYNCTIVSNTANLYGGGIHVGVDSGSVIVSNCVISANLTTNNSSGGGAGFYLQAGAVQNCTISNNISAYQGGAVCLNGSGTVSYCTIASNTAYDGGGMYLLGSSDTVSNCTITSNMATHAGGGIYFYLGNMVQNCTISYNTASDQHGGGVFMDAATSGSLRNCLIIGNRTMTYHGAGILCYAGSVYNCTIVSNTAAGKGGGIYVPTDRSPAIVNTICASNVSSEVANYDIYTAGSASNAFSYSCANYATFNPTQHNITNDPAFVNPISVNGNWRLASGSPCINTGSNQTWMTGAVDLDGRRRINQVNGRVDMGAYEFIPSITIISIH